MFKSAGSSVGVAELILSGTAQRTDEIIREILPFGSGFDSAIRISFLFIVLPAAKITNLCHCIVLLFDDFEKAAQPLPCRMMMPSFCFRLKMSSCSFPKKRHSHRYAALVCVKV